jgi:crossover junction endodeoxyribonuclease RuvC
MNGLVLDAVLGIDPGRSGAAVVLSMTGEPLAVIRGDQSADEIATEMAEAISRRPVNVRLAVLEDVHSMPKQGVASTFTFGESKGIWKGIMGCYRLRSELVSPQKWQKALGCLSGGDKNVTKAAALAMFPAVGKGITHQVADAYLLAEYARRRVLELNLLPQSEGSR